MITGELKQQVDKIWEAFWTGGISNPIAVIEQFTYLLFIRRLDEEQLKEEKKAALVGIPVKKVIYIPAQRELRWSSFKDKSPQEMFDLFTKPLVDGLSVFDHMKNVGEGVFAEYMQNATFIIGTPRLLDQVVQLIDKINMDDRDTKGDLYEYMLSKIASAGTNGQFRTPRHIIKLMVDMVEPKKDDIICDPAAGTAGFLVAAGEYFRENHPDWFHEADFREHFNHEMFHAIENDATMVRIGAMNMQLHGIENPKLQKNDSLSSDENVKNIREKYSLILANPPFKGSLDYDAVESSVLNTVKSKKTELLFLGLMLRMLTKGGRCAVIVPDGVLFGSSNAHKQIRQEIIENHKLDAVISMPSGVFKPYAGVSTAILFFTKTGTGGTKNVWFYDMKADGYTLDDKRSETPNANDLPDILARYKHLDAEKDRKRTDQSFLVPKDEIVSNDYDLSINRYKETEYIETQYDAPVDIIAAIEELDKERLQALETLKAMLC
ncbi:MAG: class I SAM-dependent DNA methyltransferase [Spirosomataceae bacterium]|jgi:type I restriction enzyme M protein